METKHRTLKHQLRYIATTATLAALTCAVTASTALAGGEPKAAPHLTRLVTTDRSSATLSLEAPTVHRAWSAIEGEAKNEQLFTVSDGLTRFLHNTESTTGARSGEPTSQSPLTTNIGGGNSPTAQAFGSSYGASS
jgi:hypothetical protein